MMVTLKLTINQCQAVRHALNRDRLSPAQQTTVRQVGDKLDVAIARHGKTGRPRSVDRVKLKQLAKKGMTHGAIAGEMGISVAGVRKIRRELGV